MWAARNLYGAETVGIEPDTAFQDKDIINDTVENGLKQVKGKFDLIVCQQSLNHFSFPVQVLKAAEDLLVPNGLICLEVLDFAEYTRMKGKRIQVDHTHYFTIGTLTAALTLAGFAVLFSESDYKSGGRTDCFLPNRHIRILACPFLDRIKLPKGEIERVDKILKSKSWWPIKERR